jgi:transcriptional regulator with XRE-family HTH domain
VEIAPASLPDMLQKAPKLPLKPVKRRGHFIREWRKFRGLSQEKLGERIGRSNAQISRIEKGHDGYTQETLEEIANALATHPYLLLARPPGPDDAISSPLTGQKRRA